jgi:hypothetical protein
LSQAEAAGRQQRVEIEAAQKELRDVPAGAEQASAAARTNESRLQATIEQQTGRADACEAKNAQLFSVTMDLIHHYKENRGAWEKFLLSEPFTGIKSVEVENLLEDMGEKAADARVSVPAPKR